MDKTAIRKYAIWARTELMYKAIQQAKKYGVEKDGEMKKDLESINGKLLTKEEKQQRNALIDRISEVGFENVIDEAAYVWFNRFSALRFMEVNDFLPGHIRIFSNEHNEFKPQILTDAFQVDIEGVDANIIMEYKDANDDEGLFKYFIVTQCNALSAILPFMFQKIQDYTELLLPDYLLREGSVIEQLVSSIPENDWMDQIQIIGWLYQYYTTEQNELVYDGSWARKRIEKELLSAATTIYTPDWSVRYMVENSLGRLWLEGHPSNKLQSSWKYYLDEIEQPTDVMADINRIKAKFSYIKPEDIKCIDPCSGSGHILCYMFDILVEIYEEYGYTLHEAVKSIVENNIWGLDVDDRAAQLAYFSVMMKARKYDRRFFNWKDEQGNISVPQPHVFSILESNDIKISALDYLGSMLSREERQLAKEDAIRLIKELKDAKEYGSILKISKHNWSLLKKFAIAENSDSGQQRIDIYGDQYAAYKLQRLIAIGEVLNNKYQVVVTNPPYLNSNRFSPKLDEYVGKEYPDEKTDLSMVMLKKSLSDLCEDDGFVSFITTSSWLFLSSFEKVRNYLLDNYCFDSIVDYGTELFDGKVGHNPITSWVSRKSKITKRITSIRLVDYCYARRDEKEPEYFNLDNRYYNEQTSFDYIPGRPIAYWASEKMIEAFKVGKTVESFAYPKQGLATADNNRFLRLWFEVGSDSINLDCSSHEEAAATNQKWYPYNKGGGFKKWYGNNSYLINWQNDGVELKAFKGSVIRSPQFYFKECGSWCKVTSASFSMRYIPRGFLFDVAGCSLFVEKNDLKYIIAYMNSSVNKAILGLISPTLNFEVGHIASLPIIFDESRRAEIEQLCDECIDICKADWDSYELSWDFKKHPLISGETYIEKAFEKWEKQCQDRYDKLKRNEEMLNKYFIEIYGLSELSEKVEENEVSIQMADRTREIKSLISYAVGCMFGRYSLDEEGVVYSGSCWDEKRYQSYSVDKDNIIPICDDDYFDDDILALFIKFICTVYGENTLEENLNYIAASLGGKGSSREIIRNYFINNFYADHCSNYAVVGSGKRPIYWLFDSGKKNGFKCLMYLHRYQPDTIARIRTDYVHEQQSRYRTSIADLEQRINGANSSDRVKLTKRLKTMQEQAEELRLYEEKIHHMADQMISIDLNDGIKENYSKLQDVLAKIK